MLIKFLILINYLTLGYQEVGLFSSPAPQTTPTNSMGDILMPMSSGPFASQQTPPTKQKLTTDVDSSLTLAASNMSLELGGTKGMGISPVGGMGMGLAPKK